MSRLLGMCLALFASLLMFAQTASAQQPTPEQRDRARAAYARGQQLFQAGDFAGAETEFESAYATIPNAVVLLGIAEARERLGNVPGTVEALEQYLRDRPSAPDRTTVQGRIDALRARPATLHVTTSPRGAMVTIDGAEQAEVTPLEVQVPPGSHTISIALAHHATHNETIQAVFGTRQDLDVVLEADAGATAEQMNEDSAFGGSEQGTEGGEGDDAPADEEAPNVMPGVVVAASISGAALIAGTVLGFLALSKQSDFDDMPSTETADDGETFALFADVSFGVAAAAGITAIVLYATQGEADDDTGTTEARVVPMVSPSSAGIGAHVTF